MTSRAHKPAASEPSEGLADPLASEPGISDADQGGERIVFITRRSLPRRTVLRGLGAAVALPFLESMVPAMTALAQSAAILAIETLELAGTGKLVYFMSIDEAKFRNPVEPGCLLELNVGFVQKRARVCKFWGKASVEGKVTCEVQFTAMVADPPKDSSPAS